MDEVGIDGDTGRVLVRVKERYFRPAEVVRFDCIYLYCVIIFIHRLLL